MKIHSHTIKSFINDDKTPIYRRRKIDIMKLVLYKACNAYALGGSLLGANLASNLHGTLVGKRETWT